MFTTNIYKQLSTPEESGKKIGLFRVLSSIFGGLIAAYLGMTLLVFIIPGTAGESIIIPLMFNTLIWACFANYVMWLKWQLKHVRSSAWSKANKTVGTETRVGVTLSCRHGAKVQKGCTG